MPRLITVLKSSCFVAAMLLGASSAAWSEDLFREGAPDLQSAVGGSKVSNGVTVPQFASLARVLSPAVVNIAVEGGAEEKGTGLEGLPDLPFFKKDPQPLNSLGSGFILSPEGYIATNLHVVKDAKRVVVRLLDDKNEYEAEIVGSDRMTDLALLKIEPKQELPPVFFGNSDEVEVGEWVMAIGNQFQLGQTVTAGIISAKSRRVGGSPSRPYDQFIQTDAPINPGSSGGPLFNTRGQVIGINTAIFSPGRMPQLGGGGFNIGIGFAIPINLAKDIFRQLKEQGKVTRGLLGVLIQEMTPELIEALKLGTNEGALVSEVKPGSPAQRAGIKRRDVLIGFNGKPVREHSDLPLMVASSKIGSEAAIELLREGKRMTVKARLGELREEAQKAEKTKKAEPDELGLILKQLTVEQAELAGVQIDGGLYVSKVEVNSPADRARILKGDVIVELNDIPLTSLETYEKVLVEMPRGQAVSGLIKRKDGAVYFAVRTLPAEHDRK